MSNDASGEPIPRKAPEERSDDFGHLKKGESAFDLNTIEWNQRCEMGRLNAQVEAAKATSGDTPAETAKNLVLTRLACSALDETNLQRWWNWFHRMDAGERPEPPAVGSAELRNAAALWLEIPNAEAPLQEVTARGTSEHDREDEWRQLVAETQRYMYAISETKLKLMWDCFPQFREEFKEIAGLRPDFPANASSDENRKFIDVWETLLCWHDGDDPRLQSLWVRGHAAFGELLGVSGSRGTYEEWEVLALAAGISQDELPRTPFKEQASRIRKFCLAKKALYHKPAEASAETQPKVNPSGGETPEALHAVDFRSVRWFGTSYIFTKMQAACVKVLWEHWERDTAVVGEQTILNEAEATGGRLRDVFDKGGHPAWGTMIVKCGKDAFELCAPEGQIS